MGYVSWMTRKVRVPVIHEFIDGAVVVRRGVWIVGRVPGVLENDGESHADVSLIDRLHRIHNAEDVVVRRRRAAERRNIFVVSFSGQLDNFHRRKYCRNRSCYSVAGKLARSRFHFILKSYTA